MKVLVTGAGGFLGAVLTERLLVHGAMDLRLFVRLSSRREKLDALVARYPNAKMEVLVGNLDDMDDARRAVDGVDVVYHLVAVGRGSAAEMFQATVVTSQNLLDALVERPVAQRPRVVLVSSLSVYGVAALPRGVFVDEDTVVESRPRFRDIYAQAKLRQEQLFWEYRARQGFQLVVVRPGVIYGPGGVPVSPRVGLEMSNIFFHLGGRNILPLTYVDNCAEGIVMAGQSSTTDGQVFNLVDDNLPTCSEFLRQYRRYVRLRTVVHVPYAITMALAYAIVLFNKLSPRKLPMFLTPYRVAVTWGGNRFANGKIKTIGYTPVVSTNEGLKRTFNSLSKLALS